MTVSPPARPRLEDREGPLTVQEIADMLRLHPETIRQWLRDGRLKGTRLNGVPGRAGGARWRIPRSELEKLDLEV